MKIFYFSIILILSVFLSEIHAQNKRIYLFNDFTNGIVIMKNQSRVSALLNYDASGKTILYKDKEENMILTNTQTIDTILISERKFIPVGRVFLEVIPVKNGTVYINWNLKNKYKGKTGAYGQTTQSNVTVINTNHYNNQAYEKQTADVFTLENENEYWLYRNDKPVKFKNKKSLLKLFPGKETSIEKFIKENKIDISNPENVVTLTEYCLGL